MLWCGPLAVKCANGSGPSDGLLATAAMLSKTMAAAAEGGRWHLKNIKLQCKA